MLKWELKQKYDEQGARFKDVTDRYAETKRQAHSKLSATKVEYESLIQQEFRTGEDLSANKVELRKRIAEAEKEAEAASAEHVKIQEYARKASTADRITVRDLVVDWNGPYRSEVKMKELQPIIDRMRAARDSYYSAVLDIYKLNDTYNHAHYTLSELERAAKRPGDGLSVHTVVPLSGLPKVTDDDLTYIQKQRTLPAGMNGGVA